MKAATILCVALAVLAVGCRQSLEQKIVGNWKGDGRKSDFPNHSPSDRMLARGSADKITLEIAEEKVFVLSKGAIPVDGQWELDGNILTLTSSDGEKLIDSPTMKFVVDASGKSMTYTNTDPKTAAIFVMDKVD